MATGPHSAVFVARRRDGPAAHPLAVKVLRHRLEGDIEALLRIREQGHRLAALAHRHLAPPLEVVWVGEHPALVTAWVDGLDLQDWVGILQETQTPMPGRVACEILKCAAAALDAALHRVPYGETAPVRAVHLDLKPSNLIVDRDGEIKVLDFGSGFTALAGRSARTGVLQTGLVRYLSPGRREGRPGGPPADVYALGILGLELLRGRSLRRLRAHNPAHDRHLAEVVANLDDLGMRTAQDGTALRNLLLRMVAWDPEARPASAEVASTFRMLVDRAPGPSLEAFVHAHALPWLDPVPDGPDPELERVQVVDLDEAPQLAAGLAHHVRPTFGNPRPEEEWEETDAGWQRTATADEEPTLPQLHPEEDPTTEPVPPLPAAPPAPDEGLTTVWEAVPVQRPPPPPDARPWIAIAAAAVVLAGIVALGALVLIAAWLI